MTNKFTPDEQIVEFLLSDWELEEEQFTENLLQHVFYLIFKAGKISQKLCNLYFHMTSPGLYKIPTEFATQMVHDFLTKLSESTAREPIEAEQDVAAIISSLVGNDLNATYWLQFRPISYQLWRLILEIYNEILPRTLFVWQETETKEFMDVVLSSTFSEPEIAKKTAIMILELSQDSGIQESILKMNAEVVLQLLERSEESWVQNRVYMYEALDIIIERLVDKKVVDEESKKLVQKIAKCLLKCVTEESQAGNAMQALIMTFKVHSVVQEIVPSFVYALIQYLKQPMSARESLYQHAITSLPEATRSSRLSSTEQTTLLSISNYPRLMSDCFPLVLESVKSIDHSTAVAAMTVLGVIAAKSPTLVNSYLAEITGTLQDLICLQEQATPADHAVRHTACLTLKKIAPVLSKQCSQEVHENILWHLCEQLTKPNPVTVQHSLYETVGSYAPFPLEIAPYMLKTLTACACGPITCKEILQKACDVFDRLLSDMGTLDADNITDVQTALEALHKHSLKLSCIADFIQFLRQAVRLDSLQEMIPEILTKFLIPTLVTLANEKGEIHCSNKSLPILEGLLPSIHKCYKLLGNDVQQYLGQFAAVAAASLTSANDNFIAIQAMKILQHFAVLLKRSAAQSEWLVDLVMPIINRFVSGPPISGFTPFEITSLGFLSHYLMVLSQEDIEIVAPSALNMATPALTSVLVSFRSRAHLLTAISQIAVAAPQHTAPVAPSILKLIEPLIEAVLSDFAYSEKHTSLVAKGIINMISFNLPGYFYSDLSCYENVSLRTISRAIEFRGGDEFIVQELSMQPHRVASACRILLMLDFDLVLTVERYQIAQIFAHFRARMPSHLWTAITESNNRVQVYLRLLPLFASTQTGGFTDIKVNTQR